MNRLINANYHFGFQPRKIVKNVPVVYGQWIVIVIIVLNLKPILKNIVAIINYSIFVLYCFCIVLFLYCIVSVLYCFYVVLLFVLYCFCIVFPSHRVRIHSSIFHDITHVIVYVPPSQDCQHAHSFATYWHSPWTHNTIYQCKIVRGSSKNDNLLSWTITCL